MDCSINSHMIRHIVILETTAIQRSLGYVLMVISTMRVGTISSKKGEWPPRSASPFMSPYLLQDSVLVVEAVEQWCAATDVPGVDPHLLPL